MYSGPLYINPANRDPGVHTGPPTGGIIICHRLSMENTGEIFFSETTTAKASIFGMQHCYVKLYINPAKHTPGVRNGPTLGWGRSIAPLDL